MNDIIQAMETRRSIRQFKPDMPRKEDLQQIIEAGLYAANGRGRQGAIILAVTNRELRDRLSALNREIGGFPEGKDPFYGAPAVLIVLIKHKKERHTVWYAVPFLRLLIRPRTPGRPGGVRAAGLRRRYNRRRSGRCLPTRPRRRGL